MIIPHFHAANFKQITGKFANPTRGGLQLLIPKQQSTKHLSATFAEKYNPLESILLCRRALQMMKAKQYRTGAENWRILGHCETSLELGYSSSALCEAVCKVFESKQLCGLP